MKEVDRHLYRMHGYQEGCRERGLQEDPGLPMGFGWGGSEGQTISFLVFTALKTNNYLYILVLNSLGLSIPLPLGFII